MCHDMFTQIFQPTFMPQLDISQKKCTGQLILRGGCFLVSFIIDMFLKIFYKAIRKNAEIFNSLEVQVGYIGLNSTHKDKMKLVSSGCTILTPVSSICLWACWSMGPVKDRFIHLKNSDNQFFRSSVTCIPSTIQGFSLLPSYFDGTENNIETVLKSNIGNTAHLLLQFSILVTKN